MLEVLCGLSRVAEAELELAECCGRPDLVKARAKLVTESPRLSRGCTAFLLTSAAGLQPGESGQSEDKLGLLIALTCEVDRFSVGGLGDGPAVGGRLVATCATFTRAASASSGPATTRTW